MDKKLSYWMQNIELIFHTFRAYALDYGNPEKRRLFWDNDGRVLFIAHLDAVQTPKIIKRKGNRLTGAGFDDRLGCCIAHELGLAYGADVLLTDLEESGRSTAKYHDLKDYNWIVEFDRAGNDVVLYDFVCPELEEALSKYWHIGFGAFSDICFLKTEIGKFNLGIGYEHAHSETSYVDLSVLKQQLKLFEDFYRVNKNTKFRGYDYCSYGWENSECCECCGGIVDESVYGRSICGDCFNFLMDVYGQHVKNF